MVERLLARTLIANTFYSTLRLGCRDSSGELIYFPPFIVGLEMAECSLCDWLQLELMSLLRNFLIPLELELHENYLKHWSDSFGVTLVHGGK